MSPDIAPNGIINHYGAAYFKRYHVPVLLSLTVFQQYFSHVSG